MCFGSSSPPPPISPQPPPPPPPADTPQSPAFNEATTDATNANRASTAARRGINSLRIDMASPSESGLNIPT